MKIVFHGGNAANFRDGIEAWLDGSHEILTLSDDLSQPGHHESFATADVIVGVRLGVSDHQEDNARVFDFALDAEDHTQIEAVLGKSRDLYRLIGDCGDEYRR